MSMSSLHAHDRAMRLRHMLFSCQVHSRSANWVLSTSLFDGEVCLQPKWRACSPGAAKRQCDRCVLTEQKCADHVGRLWRACSPGECQDFVADVASMLAAGLRVSAAHMASLLAWRPWHSWLAWRSRSSGWRACSPEDLLVLLPPWPVRSPGEARFSRGERKVKAGRAHPPRPTEF